jgi:type IV pilus assembly protein PilA
VSLQDGAIHIAYRISANALINGKILSILPAVVEAAPVVPVAWICGNAAVPGKMKIKGEYRTNIPPGYLLLSCRAAGN